MKQIPLKPLELIKEIMCDKRIKGEPIEETSNLLQPVTLIESMQPFY